MRNEMQLITTNQIILFNVVFIITLLIVFLGYVLNSNINTMNPNLPIIVVVAIFLVIIISIIFLFIQHFDRREFIKSMNTDDFTKAKALFKEQQEKRKLAERERKEKEREKYEKITQEQYEAYRK